ncbi:MAG: hypothetical protein IJW48_04755 [Clostridia bacterium]|nr:hypothetical protein [Clostridia bacterium]
MDMFEEARAIEGTLALCKLTQKELARQMGVSQSYIANKLRLLGFSRETEEKIRSSRVSERHARALLRLNCEEKRVEILEKIISRSLTVRECEALVDAAAETDVPDIIGRADKRRRIDTFFDAVKRSVDTLSSLGVESRMTRSYYGNKVYLTIVIEEC